MNFASITFEQLIELIPIISDSLYPQEKEELIKFIMTMDDIENLENGKKAKLKDAFLKALINSQKLSPEDRLKKRKIILYNFTELFD